MTSQKTDKQSLYDEAQKFVSEQSDQNIANGWAGTEVSKSLFYADPKGFVGLDSGYLVDQGSSDSELVIGPLRFSSSVQSIDVVEERAIEAPATTRADNPVLIDSGKGYQKASIRLLFEGIHEINTGLRALIVLFKTCPIISISNELLNKIWSPKSPDVIENFKQEFSSISASKQDQIKINQLYAKAKDLIKSGQWLSESANLLSGIKFDDTKLKETLQTAINRSIFYLRASKYIPVALDSITLQTVPEIPFGISAVINISHIDLISTTEDGILRYLAEGPDSFDEDPKRAFWLKKWLRQQLSAKGANYNPTISESDFGYTNISFFEKAISKIQPLAGTPSPIRLSEYQYSKVTGMSATICHKFAYHKLIGKGLPCAQHIGISGRSLTIDLDFSDKDKLLEKFSEFKATADKFIRSESIIDRVMGWVISTPITKLLGQFSTAIYPEQRDGVYFPLTVNINTTEVPGLKNATVTCLESNVSYNQNSQVILEQGGIPIEKLEIFFNNLMVLEGDFRDQLDTNNLYKFITEHKEGYSAHLALFPKDNNGLEGILNRDSIRAIFLEPSLRGGAAFREALLKLPLATGKVTSSDLRLSLLRAFFIGYEEIGVFSPSSLDDPRIKDISRLALSIGRDLFHQVDDAFISRVVSKIVIAMFGEPKEAEEAINILKGSKVIFSSSFKKALFNVVVRRPSLPSLLSRIYEKEGLFLAFDILYLEYLNDYDLYPSLKNNKKYSPITNSVIRESNYRDFRLPTYGELFGDKWQHFAPTFDTIGISYFNDRGVSSPLNSSSDPQGIISVSSVDKVPPYIWFYTKLIKSDLRRNLKLSSKGYLSLAKERYLSMNLKSTRAVNLLTNLQVNKSSDLEKIVDGADLGTDEDGVKATTKTLVEIITQNYSDSTGKIDVVRFMEDLDATSDLVDKDTKKQASNPSKTDKYRVFYEEFLHPNSPKKINLYFTTTGDDETSQGGSVTSRYQVSPIAGAAYLRVMHELKYLIKKNGDIKDISALHDQALTTVGAGRAEVQRRNLREHTMQTVKSSLDQIQDDFNSCSKLWPAARVYFLERRGNDLIADDVFFSTDSIISIDITDDKDDAALAVIKIADPLRIIQSASFGSSSTASVKSLKAGVETFDTVVLANRRKTQEGFIRQRKIEQGRSIQIRMGYGSVAEHLPIIFTGRITEIEPGDELTIVAQSWKAELINRQVNFYSSNRKSWGAKDLAVQTIQMADPDGIGEHFPEVKARALIDKLSNLHEGTIRQSLNVQKDSLLIKDASSITTDISRLLFLDTIDIYNPDARKPGLDTRLKNIWYPDMSNTINNFFKWRQVFGIHGPDFINDYWLVPLQPAWDVLKEAARHTWNFIVQVVPFDGEATLFFGHPDQLYTFSRGINIKIDQWKKFTKEKSEELTSQLERLLSGYHKWDDEKYAAIQTERAGKNGIHYVYPNHSQSDYLTIVDINDTLYQPCYTYLSELARNIRKGKEGKIQFDPETRISLREISQALVREKIANSGLPSQKLTDISNVLGTDALPILLYLFYGILPTRLHLWPSYEQHMRSLLSMSKSNDGEKNSYQEFTKAANSIELSVLTSSSASLAIDKESIKQIVTEIDILLTKASKQKQGELLVGAAIISIANALKRASTDPILASRINSLIVSISKPVKEAVLTGFERSGLSDRKDRFVPSTDIPRFITALMNTKLFLINNADISTTTALRPIYNARAGITVGELLEQSDYLFKAFIYFFGMYIQETDIPEKVKVSVQESLEHNKNPNMKVFRVHHYVDSDKDIIDNSIVATTSQMWNTVVINRPAENPADTTISDDSQLNVGTQVKTTVGWVYWPRPAVSKVIGLQFHPGLSLSNKKLKICTELNCVSDELAAKLACNNLAEGMKKMYRGTLIIRGRHIKPYDRIILNDTYTGMKGPIEVESIVHHFSVETGWVTNIVPQAVCDSNPGAAVIQTAIHEANFERSINVVGKLFDAFNLITILSAPGVGTALKATIKAVPAVFTTSLKGVASVATSMVGSSVAALKRFNFNPMAIATFLENRYKGTAKTLFWSYAANKGVEVLMQHSNNFMVTSAWVDGATDSEQRAAQLPVVLSPLIYNGAPWTAGLEADDILFAVPFFNLYYSYHDLKTAFNDYIGALRE